MKASTANLINAFVLILIPLWAYFTYEATADKPQQSLTAFIPLFLGIILLLCHNGLKKENKIIAHLAVLVTLIAIFGNATKPLMSAIQEGRNMGIFRVSIMLITSVIAMITFVRNFIKNRAKKQSNNLES